MFRRLAGAIASEASSIPASGRRMCSTPPPDAPISPRRSPRAAPWLAESRAGAASRDSAPRLHRPASGSRRRSDSTSRRWERSEPPAAGRCCAVPAETPGRSRSCGAIVDREACGRLDGETVPALRSTSLQNSSPNRTRHPGSKAVTAGAASLLGLIGALWHSILTSVLLNRRTLIAMPV